jgi:hypothetical protein
MGAGAPESGAIVANPRASAFRAEELTTHGFGSTKRRDRRGDVRAVHVDQRVELDGFRQELAQPARLAVPVAVPEAERFGTVRAPGNGPPC